MACDAEKRTLLATRYNGNKQYQFIHYPCNVYNGCMVASWLACSSLDQAVWVRARARDILLWSWVGHLTLTVPTCTLYNLHLKILSGKFNAGGDLVMD